MRPGDVLAVLIIPAVSAEPMKTMAALLDDPSPIHYDAAVVRALGLGDQPLNQGPMNLGYLARVACAAAGGGARSLHRIRVRYLDSVFAGERVECSATVAALNPDAGTVDLELRASADGRPVLSGTATISR